MGNYKTEDFIDVYPGVLTGQEQGPLGDYVAENEAIRKRGGVDIDALVAGRLPEGTPGIGPVMPISEGLVRYNNAKYDPENPLLNDTAYAQKAGYRDIPAYPGLAPHDSIAKPIPATARDTMLVSQVGGSLTSYCPIYPGDTLYQVVDERSLDDLTPDGGDTYRHLATSGTASIYNQNGEKVHEMFSTAMESTRIFKPGKKPEGMGFDDIWEAPNWMSRPAHQYTDADWEHIRELWRQEKRQGAQPLYWEDVHIGDTPAATVDGPIMEGPVPAPVNGMGLGGSKLYFRGDMLDEGRFKAMVRDEQTGIYLPKNKEDYVPPLPPGVSLGPNMMGGDSKNAVNEADIHKAGPDRGVLLNFLGRDIAIRHFSNWMGDAGWLYNIRWNIMPAETHAALGKPVPRTDWFVDYLAPVPGMAGRSINAHGLTLDMAVVKSYVYDKHVLNGRFSVELAWWIETIEGDIYIAGGATVHLPSKKVQQKR